MKKKLSLAMLLAGGMMVGTSSSASAADLGGDCCADLEERVATLEATTARKGNRKVSLTINGWVNRALLIWDDGSESDAYSLDSTYGSTRFRFLGKAKINSNWSAGYRIEIETLGDRTFEVDQNNDDNIVNSSTGLRLRESHMYIKSKNLGKVTLGMGSTPTDNFAFSSNFGGLGAIIAGSQGDFLGNALFNISNTTRVFQITGSVQSGSVFESSFLTNVVRYDSPIIAGFQLSAAWGEDDFWDATIRTTQTFGDFKFKAGIGYRVFQGDDTGSGTEGNGSFADRRDITREENLLAHAGIIHTPTGLYIHGEYSAFDYEAEVAANAPDDTYGWSVQAGIKQRWNSLGKTTIWGGYTEIQNAFANATVAQVAVGSETEATKVSLGLVQDIDAAAMHLYVTYEHQEFDISTQGSIDDMDIVLVGGVIKF